MDERVLCSRALPMRYLTLGNVDAAAEALRHASDASANPPARSAPARA
ncbi:MAG: hypothetical protein V9G23_02920 [Giesbergeria sp.]